MLLYNSVYSSSYSVCLFVFMRVCIYCFMFFVVFRFFARNKYDDDDDDDK